MENHLAIVGMSGRFPGAPDIATFWQNLRNGIESIKTFTPEEMRAFGVPDESLNRPNFVPAAAMLDDIDKFDAAFFGYAPSEARLLAPEHRLMLETAYKALEHAGIDPSSSDSPIGVYAGMGLSTYLLFNLLNHPDVDSVADSFPIMLGNDKDFLATRVAYHLGLTGPAIDVQTGCSTSLVALHLACDGLLSYQCDVALVGGVTCEVPQRAGYFYQQGGVASPDGHCRPFDAQGNGTVFGSGVGVVVVKRLEDAIEQGDTIFATVRGTAINNDGNLKLGYTAPSIEGQVEVITRAQSIAEVDPAEIGYIEAHGTATQLGDPIEVEALTQVFRATTEAQQTVALGSVKANIGHLDAAAGIAGLLKTVLTIYHGEIPPSLNYSQPNPKIDFASSPFFVNRAARTWDRDERIAGVSSFGIGGTNAHAVLAQAPQTDDPHPGDSWQLITLSASSEAALDAQAMLLAEHLQSQPETSLADLAYTLQFGRKSLPHRRTLVAETAADVAQNLSNPERITDVQFSAETTRPIIFMFSGQGSQYLDMARGLYEFAPVFRSTLDQCADLITPTLGTDIRTLIFESRADQTVTDEVEPCLNQTNYTQPALFAIGYALAQQWQAWGITPAASIGHSLGEWVAATLAGVFSLADALRLVVERGRLMQAQPGGAMLGVGLSEADVQPYLTGDLAIAAINAANSTVLSGTFDAIDTLEAQLAAANVNKRRLHTSHAFHSAMMAPALEPFRAAVAAVQRNAPTQPFVSNISGTWITAEQATDPDYWAQQIRQPVRFAGGIETLLSLNNAVLLEVGPGKALTTIAKRRIGQDSDITAIASLRHPHDPTPDRAFMWDVFGRIWQSGLTLNWQAIHTDQYGNMPRRRIPLPTYPFARERHWLNPPSKQAQQLTSIRQPDMADWFTVPSWQRTPLPTSGVAASQPVHIGSQADFGRITAQTSHIIYDAPLSSDTFDTTLYDVLALGKKLSSLKQPVTLLLASRSMHKVTGTEAVAPTQAALLGALRVLPQELPHVTVRSIDFDAAVSAETITALLTSEQAAAEPVVSYRNGRRWTQTYLPHRLVKPSTTPLKQQGVYLITGGLGGIGLALANYLASQHQARLVLTTRRQLDAKDPIQQSLGAMRASGGDVLVVQADVTDAAQLNAAIAQANATFGPLNGVIHAAGVAGGGLVAVREPSEAAQVLAPKVDGTQQLATALADQPLDFLLLISSITAHLGGVGQLDYAAANSYLNAFAHGDHPWPVKALNWSEWQGVGMTAKAELPDAVKQWRSKQMQGALNSAEALETFERALASSEPELLIAPHQFAWLQQQFADMNLEKLLAQLAAHKPVVVKRNKQFVAPRNQVEQTIVTIWQETLGIDEIGIHDNFFDLGGSSLIGIKLVNQINSALNSDIDAVALYEKPTVGKLTELVTANGNGTSYDESQSRGERRRNRRRRKK